MCGIWAFISNKKIQRYGELYDSFMSIKHRGPDYSSLDLIHPQILLGFHRLAIIDLSIEGNQPFHHISNDKKYMYSVTNGEIYNYAILKKENNIVTRSLSDCEIILPLYEKFGIERLCGLLGSEFATIIVEINYGKIKIIAARDPVGVRPLFYSLDSDGLYLSSEVKGLCKITKSVNVFPPGSYLIYEPDIHKFEIFEYYSYSRFLSNKTLNNISIGEVYKNIRQLLINSVFSRLKSDRDIGCLLSGGLDSSLVAGICRYILPNNTIHSFTITFKSGGTDLPYAKKVAEFLKFNHHIIEIDEEEALKEIIPTIYSIESYDITSVRASIMQKLIARYISKNTDIKVLLVGENSDELFGGYLYSHLAPSSDDLKKDTINLVRDVHMFDGLRTDRTMSSEGLEVRLPFADVDLVNYVFSLPSEYIQPENGIEKALLRNSFTHMNLIPKEVLWRRKEAFSDAVTNLQKSWYQILSEHIENLVSDEEFSKMKNIYTHNTPFTKESYYYRKIFETLFGSSDKTSRVIKYFWMPKWSETNDPSARTLINYTSS